MDRELQALLKGARVIWQEIQERIQEKKPVDRALVDEMTTAITAIARRSGCPSLCRWNDVIDHVDRTFPGWRGIPNPVPSDRHKSVASRLKEDRYA